MRVGLGRSVRHVDVRTLWVADVIFQMFIITLEPHHPKDVKNGKLFGQLTIVDEVVHYRLEVVNWCASLEEDERTDKISAKLADGQLVDRTGAR